MHHDGRWDMVSGHGGDGLWLDLVILEAFSNLKDSMILRGHCDDDESMVEFDEVLRGLF